jgi:hypothetical protein
MATKKVVKKDTHESKKTGRPTKYNPAFHPGWAEALASKGLTNPQISEKMDIAESTLIKWMSEHEEFSVAIRRGREDPDDKVEKTLFELATGFVHRVEKPIVVSDGADNGSHVETVEYTERVIPNVTAQIFWLKNRRPGRWMEKTTSVNLNVNKSAEDLTPEEEAEYKKHMKAAFPQLSDKE